ncbi:MAG: ECF RNA polymerase sigma-E factor [Ignavibacteriaceae bacterium]|nr:ECF RNA polymerase sigma-E factor [Ignavibacteriaceae bacterium]
MSETPQRTRTLSGRKPDDLEVIRSVREGNTSDFSILMDRYKNKAFSLILRMLKNRMDAEEVLQDCFVKAWKNLDSFKGDSQFATWFYRIVYNTTLTKLTGKKRETEKEMLSIGEDVDIRDEHADTSAATLERNRLLGALIAMLTPNQAAVVNLFYLDGLSCEEIAGILDTNVGNVKTLLHRSRATLKNLIQKKNLHEELR